MNTVTLYVIVTLGLAISVAMAAAWRHTHPAKPKTPKPPADAEINDARIAELETLLPLGSRFEYLGRRMQVVSHNLWPRAGLRAEYSDKTGIIRAHEFWYAEALLLKRLP